MLMYCNLEFEILFSSNKYNFSVSDKIYNCMNYNMI